MAKNPLHPVAVSARVQSRPYRAIRTMSLEVPSLSMHVHATHAAQHVALRNRQSNFFGHHSIGSPCHRNIWYKYMQISTKYLRLHAAFHALNRKSGVKRHKIYACGKWKKPVTTEHMLQTYASQQNNTQYHKQLNLKGIALPINTIKTHGKTSMY